MNAIALVAFLALAAAPPRAPTPAEEKLFGEGMAAMSRGDARAAEKAWRAGYDIARDPAFLVRIGEAQEKAAAPSEAAETYRRYLREAADAADRADIEARVVRLSPPVPVPPPAVDEVPGSLGGARAEPGPAAAPVAPAMPPVRAAQADTGTDAPGGSGGDEEESTSAIGVAGWISVGLAVTLIGAAGFYGASASAQKDDVNTLLRFQEERTGRPLEYETVARKYEDATRDGQRYDRYATNFALASGGAAGLALILFVVDAAVGSSGPRAAAGIGRLDLALDGRGGAAALAGWSF